MSEQLKKNWFIIVVALMLIIATVFYVNDQSKNAVKSKKVNGEQVVFSIGGENYFIKDYEKALDESLGDSALYQIFRRELLSNMEASEDIQADSKFKAESFITYIKQAQGQKGLDQANAELVAMGYTGIDDLAMFYENEAKYQEFISAKFMEKYDELFKADVEKNKPRKVSHILIKIADAKNPSDAELEKIKKVDEALEKKTPFEEVASQYSDDTGSAQQGGNIGVVDANANLVKPFLEAMLTLEKDEVSDWVESDYGKHRIVVVEDNFEKLLKDADYFMEIEEDHQDIVSAAIWEQAEKLNIEFASSDVENRIKKLLGLDKEDN